MRQFVRSAVAMAAVAAFSAGAQAQQVVTLKMQATWPASLTLYENFTYFAERVGKLSNGTLKIDAMPAGQVVPAFEVLDATHKKVLDGAHAWSGYWVGKNKAAILCTGGPGGTFGMDMIDAIGWMHHGGGNELCNEFFQKELKLNVHWMPILPSGPQAFGWFKRPIKNLADFKGMKCRQTGIAAGDLAAHGHDDGQHARRRDHPVGAARRDRLRRVGRRRRGPAPGLPQRLEVPLHAGHARERDHRRGGVQHGRVEGPLRRSTRK